MAAGDGADPRGSREAQPGKAKSQTIEIIEKSRVLPSAFSTVGGIAPALGVNF
jgi:hypothetical protein